MIVILNRSSNNGHGLRKWDGIRRELEERGLAPGYRLISGVEELAPSLRDEICRGPATVVAAGGDGTVHHLLNGLMSLPEDERRNVIVGAVGLGSSNDFHKPHSPARSLDGHIYYKLDSRNALPHNVGRVDYDDEAGRRRTSYFLLNCSIGIIAQANHLFNNPDRLLGWLKSRFVAGAIYYAALKTIFSAPDIPATIAVGKECLTTDVTNLSVVINPHFTGNLSYDFDVDARSEHFGVGLCERMGARERLRTLGSLARARFRGLPKTRTWMARTIEVLPGRPTALEMDGEVCLASNIRVQLLRGYLKVCQ